MAFQSLINRIGASLISSRRAALFHVELRRYLCLDPFHGLVKRVLIERSGIHDLSVSPTEKFVQALRLRLAGGNITPTWTFVQFKGPNGILFTAQGTRTHILNITLGPAAAGSANAPSQAVSNNQYYLLLNSLFPPVVR
jgi:hypothetical protein